MSKSEREKLRAYRRAANQLNATRQKHGQEYHPSVNSSAICENQSSNNEPAHFKQPKKIIKMTRSESIFGGSSLLLIVCTILCTSASGPFGLFADKPGILLWPFGISVCVLIGLISYRLHKYSDWHWRIYILSALLATIIVASGKALVGQKTAQIDKEAIERQQEHAIITNLPKTTFESATSDYIEGTKVTSKQLEQTFPFGYVVVRQKDAKWIYTPYLTEHVKIDTLWNDVKFTPDFEHHTVSVDILGMNFELPDRNIIFKDIGLSGKGPMVVGRWGMMKPTFLPLDQPQFFVGTLSDNQVHPVFVIGLRIP